MHLVLKAFRIQIIYKHCMTFWFDENMVLSRRLLASCADAPPSTCMHQECIHSLYDRERALATIHHTQTHTRTDISRATKANWRSYSELIRRGAKERTEKNERPKQYYNTWSECWVGNRTADNNHIESCFSWYRVLLNMDWTCWEITPLFFTYTESDSLNALRDCDDF